MRELRTCDFCGGDGVGTFEVVPPELEPSEAEQRRVVLCADCKGTLEVLLEPLLARAGVDSGATTSDSDGTDRDGSRPASTTDADASAGRRGDEDDVDGVDDADAGVGDPADTRDETGDGDSRSGSALEDGITFERSEPAETDADERGESDEAVEKDDTGDDETVSEDPAADDSAARETAERPPKAYGKVMRLLRNRHFPMQRSAVEELAAGAYDLDPPEVEAVVDHAIERGEFVENRDLLERVDESS